MYYAFTSSVKSSIYNIYVRGSQEPVPVALAVFQ